MSDTYHKQVAVIDNCGDTVEVDEGMVDILRLFWNIDIDTCLSCEDNNGRMLSKSLQDLLLCLQIKVWMNS
jgi:hypothetical protein